MDSIAEELMTHHRHYKVKVKLGNIEEVIEVDLDVDKMLERAAYIEADMQFRRKYPRGKLIGGAPSYQIVKPRCYGAMDEHDQPICDGPDVRKVRASGPESDFEGFTTEWCSQCRDDAIHLMGFNVEVLS
jgi:hypothetical protein